MTENAEKLNKTDLYLTTLWMSITIGYPSELTFCSFLNIHLSINSNRDIFKSAAYISLNECGMVCDPNAAKNNL